MPMDVYQVSHLPFKVLPLDFTLVVIAAVVVLPPRHHLSVEARRRTSTRQKPCAMSDS